MPCWVGKKGRGPTMAMMVISSMDGNEEVERHMELGTRLGAVSTSKLGLLSSR